MLGVGMVSVASAFVDGGWGHTDCHPLHRVRGKLDGRAGRDRLA